MIIDMHMHEMRYSGDSFLRLENMVEIAKRRGLDGICITDHDSMGLKEFAAEYSEKTEFPIFVGIEFYSLQGDIVAFGIEDYPKERIPAQEFVDLVQAQGGMCFSAHPFRNNNRGLEENLALVRGLDGVEVLNGSTSFAASIATPTANGLTVEPKTPDPAPSNTIAEDTIVSRPDATIAAARSA